MSTASFFAAPDYGDREPARPKAVNPRTGKEQSWTRASSYAASLDNPHGLIKWQGRELIRGLSLRPDLARMLLAGTPIEDKTKADEMITAALATAATDSNANEGTAAHSALVRSWLHQDQAPEPEFLPLVQSFARALKEHGLTPKAAEQRVMNLAFNSLGSLDWVFEEADGTDVIGDVKTGKLTEAKRKFAAQMALYDGSEFVVHEDGSVAPIPWQLARTHAVLVHIDLENGNAISVYRVDLNIGRYGAGLAEQVRQWHKLDPLTPYVRPVVKLHQTQTSTVEPAVRTDPPGAGGASTTAEAAPPTPSPAVAPAPSNSVGPTVTEEPATAATSASPTEAGDRFEHWMKLDKAPLQMELKKRGWTDISHNRRWLARALVVIEQGWTDQAMIKKYASAKDDWSPEQGHTAPAEEVVTQDATNAVAEIVQGPSVSALSEAIAGANSVGALEALRADIVERRGDQAWTEALVAEVRNRAYELGELPISETSAAAVLGLINQAPNQEALKNLWVRTTLGGSIPERWQLSMTEAGTARLKTIAAALPPAPTNPFGD